MQWPRSWLGFLSALLLCCIAIGLASAALPEDSNTSGYYDGDDDDPIVAPDRMATLVDMAVGARAVVLPERAPDIFESRGEPAAPPVVDQSPPPPLRSPPDV